MTESTGNRRRRGHLWLWLPICAVACFLVYLLFIAVSIAIESRQQQLHSADAIVVFGAAEYDGRPSPVLRARLDHAFRLYKQHLAPVIITTGGAAADPKYSEGGVGHDYLMKRGVPEANLIAETQGSDTSQSAQRVGVIMRANGMHSCIAVSDAYHVFRIRKLLEHEKISVYVAPRPDSRPRALAQRLIAVLRESISYMLWQIGITS